MLTIRQLLLCETPCPKRATLYLDSETAPRACILYFHGGGLLYGNREDLPERHKQTLTQAGYAILALDYPLAPAVKLDGILSDVCASIDWYLQSAKELLGSELPYFLWGRSAGAYLCLLAAASGKLQKAPAGILSYYGYGFLCDGWFITSSKHYAALPPVGEEVLRGIPADVHMQGPLSTHYGVYVYARQTGKWLDLIYEGRMKFFYLNYTLRACEKLPCPVFCAHSTGDPDVPYSEFLELCSRYRAQRFVAAATLHDFDREENSFATGRLMESTVRFLNQRLE